MNAEKQNWELLVCEARAEAPATVSTMALTIFPPIVSSEQTAQQIAAGALRNLLAYIVRLSVQYYSVQNPDELPFEMSEFLSKLRSWLRKDSNSRLFIEKKIKPLSAEETQTVFREARSFPKTPDCGLNRIQYAYTFFSELLSFKNCHSSDLFAALYRLSSEWNAKLSKSAMQLFPSQKPLEFARMHISRNIRRIDCHTARSVVWGKELYESFQMYENMGMCPRTAKAKARKDFIAAHPIPQNDGELLDSDTFPGHSRPAVLRYIKKYLDNLQK